MTQTTLFWHLEKELSLFTTIVPSTPTTGHQDAAYGSTSALANRPGQKRKNKNYCRFLIHSCFCSRFYILPPLWFERCFKRDRLLWGIQKWQEFPLWNDRSYKLFQGNLQLNVWNKSIHQPQQWISTGTCAQPAWKIFFLGDDHIPRQVSEQSDTALRLSCREQGVGLEAARVSFLLNSFCESDSS